MAEFGENLKRAREKRGMTQQSLAEELYVTRQAVSRWENGSRYPDLITARRLSEILNISLDELIKDDEMLTYPQKSAIIEFPRSKRLQTAIFAFCVALTAVQVLIQFARLLFALPLKQTPEGSALQIIYSCSAAIAAILLPCLLTVMLLYAVWLSINDRVTPKTAALILGVYFGIGSVVALAEIVLRNLAYRNTPIVNIYSTLIEIARNLLPLSIAVILVWYFKSRKCIKPNLIYGLSVAYCLLTVGFYAVNFVTAYQEIIANETPQTLLLSSISIVIAVMTAVGMSALLCYLARELYRKRLVTLRCK